MALQPKMRFAPGFTALYNDFCNWPRGQALLSICGIDRKHLDICTMASEYFENPTGDISIDANANVGNAKSPSNYSAEVVKGISKLTAYHLLWSRLAEDFDEERASELIAQLWKGYLYFHDLTGHGITTPYCFAATTLALVFEGRPYGQLQSKPPKRSSSFMAQAVEFTMDMSQEFMGAIGLSDLIVNLALFLKAEGVKPSQAEYDITNEFQKFVHVINNKFRLSSQSPFTNISVFDRPQLKALFAEYEHPSGVRADESIEYIMNVQEIFMRFMAKKDPSTNMPYRFPIATVNLTTKDGKVLDKDFLKVVCELNTEGVFNIYNTEGIGRVASCCRLLSDTRTLNAHADVWGNGSLNVGSMRVCTVNLARLAFDTSGPREFKAKLLKSLQDARDLLLVHRKIVEELIEVGYLKFFKPLNWINIDMMFSTIGVVGLYEALCLFGEDYELPKVKGVEQAEKILKYMDDVAQRFTKKTEVPFNVEQVPAETAAIKLANMDRIFYPDSPFSLYSNQSIPLWIDVDLVTRARVDGKLNRSYSGGGICHLNIGSKVTPDQMEKLICFAIHQGLDHFALNPVFSQCAKGHTVLGKVDVCGVCGERIVTTITRVVGYFVPVADWTKVRREIEFPKRVWGALPSIEEEKEEAMS